MPALLRTTQIQEPSSASVNLTLDTSGNGTFAGTAVMSSPYTMRNKIINGAMIIDQRNAGAAQNNLAAGWVYTVDRWEVYSQSSSRFSSQQNRGSVTPPTGFTNYLGLVVNTGYSVSAADYNLLQQPVEGFNIADLAWGSANARSVTLSFKVYSSLTGTHSGYVSVSALTTAYPFTFTVSSANTWTDISVTIAGPTTGTWPTNNTAGLVVGFNLGSGSNYQTASPNAWNSSAAIQPSSALSVVATTGATFYITGVQLERGTVATPFEYRNYQQELAMCQRYCPVFVANPAGGYQPFAVGQSSSTTQALITLIFPVSTRTPPSGITISAASDFACWQPATSSTSATSITFNTATYLAGVIQLNGMSGLTQGYATTMISNNTANSKIIFTGSEL